MRNPFRSRRLERIEAILKSQSTQLSDIYRLAVDAKAQGSKIMSAVDDGLKTLSDDLSALSADFSAGIAALQAAIAAGDPAAIAAQVAQLATLDASVKAMDATAKALVPPPATPAA